MATSARTCHQGLCQVAMCDSGAYRSQLSTKRAVDLFLAVASGPTPQHRCKLGADSNSLVRSLTPQGSRSKQARGGTLCVACGVSPSPWISSFRPAPLRTSPERGDRKPQSCSLASAVGLDSCRSACTRATGDPLAGAPLAAETDESRDEESRLQPRLPHKAGRLTIGRRLPTCPT